MLARLCSLAWQWSKKPNETACMTHGRKWPCFGGLLIYQLGCVSIICYQTGAKTNNWVSFFFIFFLRFLNTLTQNWEREDLRLWTRPFRNGVLFATKPFPFLPFFKHAHTSIALQSKTSTNPANPINTTQRPFPKMAMERKQPHSYKDVCRYLIAEIES